MTATPVRELIPVLQVAIGPVILISGIGMLLLTLTNRYGRTIDRARHVVRELREVADADRQRLKGQVEILYRRARLIRLSIALAGVSALLAAVLIIVLFLTALLKLEVGLLISLVFICCMMSLIGSIGAFIRDINLSLVALKLELGEHTPGKAATKQAADVGPASEPIRTTVGPPRTGAVGSLPAAAAKRARPTLWSM